MLTALMGSTCVSTSFSREGRMLWISQTVPAAARTQVAARLLCGGTLTAAGAAASAFVLIVFAGLAAAEAIAGTAAGLFTAFPLLASAIIPDAMKPKRKWNSEAEAIKQNMNSIFALLVNIGVAVGIGVTAAFLNLFLPFWFAAGITAAACTAAGWAFFGYAVKVSEVTLRTIDG
jgi:hypothetical protein